MKTSLVEQWIEHNKTVTENATPRDKIYLLPKGEKVVIEQQYLHISECSNLFSTCPPKLPHEHLSRHTPYEPLELGFLYKDSDDSWEDILTIPGAKIGEESPVHIPFFISAPFEEVTIRGALDELELVDNHSGLIFNLVEEKRNDNREPRCTIYTNEIIQLMVTAWVIYQHPSVVQVNLFIRHVNRTYDLERTQLISADREDLKSAVGWFYHRSTGGEVLEYQPSEGSCRLCRNMGWMCNYKWRYLDG